MNEQVREGQLVPEEGMAAMINRSEIEQQISTARRFPRSLKRFRDEALQMVTLSESIAEQCVYDPDSGQLLTGSFMDYAMPRPEIMKRVELHDHSVPSPTNPLGVKGAGEAGSIPVPALFAEAIEDALAPFGVRIAEMPLSPTRLWELING